jgi:predicted transglutaminase-like cysteine proteinase/thiol-disulfide isomerase/thioredoxin
MIFPIRRSWLAVLLLASAMHLGTIARAEGAKTIPFVFTDIHGKPVRLADFKGQWVLVNFWAYWCPLCWIEVPALNELNSRQDFSVIGIGMDYGQDESAMLNAVRQHDLQFRAIVAGGNRHDPDAAYRQVGPVDFFPTSYLYDPDGELVMFIPGQLHSDKLIAFMQKWSAGKPLAPAQPAYAMDAGKFRDYLTRHFGTRGRRAYLDWHALIDGLAHATEIEKLARVNDFFNRRIRRMPWDPSRHLATLGETLGGGRGDSADFAIAKYFTLLALRVPPDRLRLVYVSQSPGPEGSAGPVHMVLAYYERPDQVPLILDNLIHDIRTASQRPDLKPVYSFNIQNVWPAPGQAGTPDLTMWEDTLRRARDEGFE